MLSRKKLKELLIDVIESAFLNNFSIEIQLK